MTRPHFECAHCHVNVCFPRPQNVANAFKIADSMHAGEAACTRDINVKWEFKTDILQSREPYPVVIPKERLEPCVAEIRKSSYFADQKSWVATVMQKNSMQTASAVIVNKFVKQQMCKALGKALGEGTRLRFSCSRMRAICV